MLQEAKTLVDTAMHTDEPSGFWCQKVPKNLGDEQTAREWRDWTVSLNSKGIVLLEYDEHDNFAAKLVEVIQRAAGDIRQGG